MLVLFILFVMIRIIVELQDCRVYQIQLDVQYALLGFKKVKNEN